jgi:nucleoside-diphosphate-sugar epimerase
MKNVLITGVTGFIGRSLVRHFRSDDGIKLFGHSRDYGRASMVFEHGGLTLLPTISSDVLLQHSIDSIIHLAGIAHDLSGKFADDDYHQVNFIQTKELYDQYASSSATEFIFVSSIKAAVDHSDVVIDEGHAANPSSAYGKSKLLAEQYINKAQFSDERNAYILRPCMVHGPGNKGNLNLLYRMVKKGIPYPLAAYSNQRSFLSIENFCFVTECILKGRLSSGTYHLADTNPLSTTDLVLLIARGIEKKILLLKLPKPIVSAFALFGSWLGAPFNKSVLSKLTENLVVSNRKLLLHLGQRLPVASEEGLMRTIRSFDE